MPAVHVIAAQNAQSAHESLSTDGGQQRLTDRSWIGPSDRLEAYLAV